MELSKGHSLILHYSCFVLLLYSHMFGCIRAHGHSGGAVQLPLLDLPHRSDLPHGVILVGPDKYVLRWAFTDTDITFEARVHTTGYVGLGISPDGFMNGSDIVIGGVGIDGLPYFTDRYADGTRFPQVDESQDWLLLSADQSKGFTTLLFTRPLRTCDSMDRNITANTIHLIWSYSVTNALQYHGQEHRGTVSVHMFDPPPEPSHMPKDAFSLDFTMDKTPIPENETMYLCRVLKVPKQLNKKHHMLKVQRLIQEGNEKLIHHIDLYSCTMQIDEAAFNLKYYDCLANHEMAKQTASCVAPITVFAVGTKVVTYPKGVGIPIGVDEIFFKIEIHYNNVKGLKGHIDSSGVRVWVTPTPQPVEAGMMLMGVPNMPPLMIIPPGQAAYRYQAWCTPHCLRWGMGSQAEFNIVSVLLHMHTVGASIRVRHFRAGHELPEVIRDDNFDFNNQRFRELATPVKVLQGDTLLVECVYNTLQRQHVTYDGPSSRDEMCQVFVIHYPKTAVMVCVSMPTSGVLKLMPGMSLESIHKDMNFTKLSKLNGYDVEQVMRKDYWDDETNAQQFQNEVLTSDVYYYCALPKFRSNAIIPVPKVKIAHRKEASCSARVKDHKVTLQKDVFSLKWSYNSTRITFEIKVKSIGFVGFGISRDGNLSHSDVIVANVNKDNVYFKDSFILLDWYMPRVDHSQDWSLISATQNYAYTTVKFTRPLLVCDSYDVNIMSGPVHIIWAFSEGQTQLSDTHMKWSGPKSLYLIHGSLQEMDKEQAKLHCQPKQTVTNMIFPSKHHWRYQYVIVGSGYSRYTPTDILYIVAFILSICNSRLWI